MDKYQLIYLRNGSLLISRRSFKDWQSIQAAFPGYMTSLNFAGIEELEQFLAEEYRLSQADVQSLLIQEKLSKAEAISLDIGMD